MHSQKIAQSIATLGSLNLAADGRSHFPIEINQRSVDGLDGLFAGGIYELNDLRKYSFVPYTVGLLLNVLGLEGAVIGCSSIFLDGFIALCFEDCRHPTRLICALGLPPVSAMLVLPHIPSTNSL